ncbi:MAG: PQQ-binding-like beta-propeller repeat protein [Thermomicrobiales bacterium]
MGEQDPGTGTYPRPGLPFVVDGTLYVSSNGFGGAHTAALDALTGEPRWSVPTGDFSAGAPAMVDGVLLVGSDTGDLLGLDPVTGAELWRVAIPEKIDLDLNQATPPLTGNGWIYTRDETGGVAALIATMS